MINCAREKREQIGRRFRKFRSQLTMSQSDMGIILDMNQTSITSIEKGKSLPTIPVILYLRDKYDLSVIWLLTGEGEMLNKLNKADKRAGVNYGEYKDEMKDLMFHLDHVPEVREFILEQFILYKFRHKKNIENFFKTLGKSKKDVNANGGENGSGEEEE